MATAQGQGGHWAVEGKQLFSSAALVCLVLWGWSMPLVSRIPKRACCLFFGFVSCSLWCSPGSCAAVAVNGCFSYSLKKSMQLCGISKLRYAAT